MEKKYKVPAASEPVFPCLHELFEEEMERSPEAPAVVCGQQELSYRELNRRANRLAHHLRKLGVQAEARVAICMERGAVMIEAMLAVLKAGGAYVPLDPGYPEERLRFVLEDSQAQVVLKRGLPQAFGHGGKVPVLDLVEDEPAWAGERESNPKREETGVNPESLAYVIYTSGSTGRPKGVMVEHHSIANRIRALQSNYGFTAEDRILQFASIAFDASVEEIFGALLCGATLVLRDDSWLRSPEDFLERCRSSRASVLDLPTRFWQSLAESAARIPECVRLIIIGGEALDQGAFTAWRKREGHRPRLVNSYGPTEATVVATLEEMDREGVTWRSIGRPIGNTQIHILDERGEPAPAGAMGELYIGGAGVARGYWNRPELTAERFLEDRFAPQGGRMYRTGDLGRWMESGWIEFLGRNDEQVKIRGYRIELGEIETVLAAHAGVGEAVVIAREDGGEKRLVAYYTSGEGKEIGAEELREHVAARLPEYMVPAGYVRLERIPLTTTGKLDRQALPEPEYISSAPYRAPQNPEEKILCRLFAEVLGIKRVGMNDDFFRLGGHSLLLMNLLAKIGQELGWELSWRTFAMKLTPAAIVEQIGNMPRRPQPSNVPSLEWGHRPSSNPLSRSQKRVWFIHELDPDETAYRFAATISFTGALDVEALERTLNAIVERHEILRTTFASLEGEPRQLIHPFQRFSLRRRALAPFSPDPGNTDLQKLIQEEIRAEFRLEQLPLIRWALVQLGDREHMLVHVEHHLIHDGWSFYLFLAELTQVYSHYADPSRPLKLPELKFQFADYACWEDRWLKTSAAQQQQHYWTAQLSNPSPQIQLPFDHPRKAAGSFGGASIKRVLPLPLSKELRALSAREGVTLFMTMLAGFAALLSRYSGQKDLMIGSAIANRRHPNSHSVIGMFVNTVILRCDLSGNPAFRELLQRVRETALDAFENQEFPLEKIVEVLKPARVPGVNPLFQTMFSFDDAPFHGPAIPGLDLSVCDPLSTGGSKVDLDIMITPSNETRRDLYPVMDAQGMTLLWEYNSSLFEAATAERMIGHYVRMLQAMADDPDQRIQQADLLPEEEWRRVLYEWNDTASEHPGDKCLHELFEEEVERRPEAPAVVCGQQELSYRELNRRANRLAHHLRKLGVKAEARVAICMERGAVMIEAMLAVLKAGGAYVPLDPGYPEERLRFVLEDSQAQVALKRGLPQAFGYGGKVPVLDLVEDEPAWAGEPESNPKREETGVNPESLAYVIYTSGSTGRPKGVMVEHHSIANRIRALQSDCGFKAEDRILQFTSITFDVSLEEIFGALLCGATLVLRDDSWLRSPEDFLERCRSSRTSVLDLPTRFWQSLAESAARIPECVRLIIIGGDALEQNGLAAWRKREGHRPRLINCYGPTETTISATLEEMDREGVTWRSIGRPIGNTQVYILDERGEPAPVGVMGELYIGGAGVARGYWNRPELTAERFLEDRFAPQGGRMYRTGDLGRWMESGWIEFLGRNDEQVKIRGYRIELGEIEAVLAAHAGVGEAVVIAREDGGEKRLVAYYTASGEGKEIGAEELREHVAAKLPEYMVPAGYVRLERIPLTTAGKLDSQALPKPGSDAYAMRKYEAPQGEVEETLAEIWSELLRIERIGRQDDFFQLGGHSLMASRLVLKIHQHFEVDIDLREIFEFTRLCLLAAEIRNRQLAQFDPGELEAAARSMGIS